MEYRLKNEDDEEGAPTYTPSYWEAREEADRQREGGSSPSDQPVPEEELNVPPELDFTSRGFGAPDESSAELKSELQTQHGSPAPSTATPEAKPDDEYLSALRRIKGLLSKPAPDYGKGYAEAQEKDTSENRTNRILDYLSAGLRRAPTASLTPAATNAADFLKKQMLGQQHDETELARAGKLAAVAKPAKGAAGGGNVDGLRAYLVKVGAGTAEELAGMNEKQLGAVKEAYGLKYRVDNDAAQAKVHGVERAENLDYRERSLQQQKDNAAATRALAARGISEKNKDDVSKDAKELAGKLGDEAEFEQKYNELRSLADANGGELPGLGFVEGVRQQPGLIGNVARAVSPPTDAAIKGRKALQQLAAKYKNAISGAGVNEAESSRLEQASVDVNNSDPRIAMAGLESLRDMYRARSSQLKKGYRPEAVEQVSPAAKDHGAVVRETKSVREYADGFLEPK